MEDTNSNTISECLLPFLRKNVFNLISYLNKYNMYQKN